MRAIIILTTLTLTLGCEEKPTPGDNVGRSVEISAKDSSPTEEMPEPESEPKTDPTKHERFLWKFETRADVYSSPAIGSDGTVYVGSYDNKLYAIKTDSKGLAKSPWPMRGQNARHTGRVMKKN